MKFRTGDYVKILNGANINDYVGLWSGGMAAHVGEVHEIEYGDLFRDGREGYTLCGLPYTFDGRGLEFFAHRRKPTCIIDETICGYGANEIANIWVNREREITTVEFGHGDKVTVKCADGVPFDEYFAVASALAEHVYGDNSKFKKAIKEHTHYLKPKKPKKPKTGMSGEVCVDAMSVALQPLVHSIDERIKKLEKKIEKARIGDGE